MSPHDRPLTPSILRSIFNFDGALEGALTASSQARLQSQGVAALWELLESKTFAYLGDEVGMGKTRQAIGVIVTQFLNKPASQVVIICPGRTLQGQWLREWTSFLLTCYRLRDDRLVSSVDGGLLEIPELHERLRDFARSLLLNENRIHLLRYSSFSRPVWFGSAMRNDPDAVFAEYLQSLREIGIPSASESELGILQSWRADQEGWRASMTEALNEEYAKRVGALLKMRGVDLLVFDEAQYLRHVDNRQNTNLRHVFRGHMDKTLFMSATPLHSGPSDIRSLDHYLCREADGPTKESCASCSMSSHCTRARHRLDNGTDKIDVVSLLKEFLVRRTRSHVDQAEVSHGKIHYRKYERHGVSAARDPLFALTMALVQKRLVQALSGRNNQFRQGECSSFESLATSIKRTMGDTDGIQRQVPELEMSVQRRGNDTPEQTPDRASIEALNKSFRKNIVRKVVGALADQKNARYDMPHAKLQEVADQVFQRSLRNASNHKSLIFVRRIDTVNELVALLLARFQDDVDQRIAAWHDLLSNSTVVKTRSELWPVGRFWTHRIGDGSEEDDDAGEEGTAQADHTPEGASALPYLISLKRKRGRGAVSGLLSSFQARLLRPPHQNPLHGFLVEPEDGKASKDPKRDDFLWQAARESRYWERLVALLYGQPVDQINSRNENSRPSFVSQPHDAADKWKLAVLRRCILQSLRQTDFIVDLYILNRYVGYSRQGDDSLPAKLLWFLGEGRTGSLGSDLESYVANCKTKLRQWFELFDLIVSKCLLRGAKTEWRDIYRGVDAAFAGMAPVLGRSGAIVNKNAVTQFNFPVSPNVLVCTDVLKEGVDMHLFCDDVVHYGVAWTSGDLEQRIGRIDRLGSKISRSIARHAGARDLVPRLRVQFPYLAGTLDEHQVAHVITEKLRSDLRMDLGKEEQELRVISTNALGLEDMNAVLGEDLTVLASERLFYPVPADGENPVTEPVVQPSLQTLSALAAFRLPAQLDGDEIRYHVRSPDAILVRRTMEVAAIPGLLCLVRATTAKNRPSLVRAEFLVPAAGTLQTFPPAAALTNDLASRPVLAVPKPDAATGFVFSAVWSTAVLQVQVTNLFDRAPARTQTVLLERMGYFSLVRTPIFHCSSEPPEHYQDWPGWIASQNFGRQRWGHLMIDSGIVWFGAFVLDQSGTCPLPFLRELGERVGKIGERIQHVFGVEDEQGAWAYQSRTLFPSLQLTSPQTYNFFTTKEDNNMDLHLADMRGCGQMLATMQAWFKSAFNDVLEALYESTRDRTSLRVLPIIMLEEGILLLQTETRGRFILQAFLDLRPVPHAADPFPYPRLVWELVASPILRGAMPILEFSSWDELPHLAPDLGWEGEVDTSCAVYTGSNAKYRYAVLYVRPHDWDCNRKDILQAWRTVLEKLQIESQFRRQDCKDAFSSAVKSLPAS